MVNGPDDVFVEREGRIERVPDRLFEGEEPVLHLIERIVGPLGLRVDQASPWVDARLPDGSRVHTGSSRALFLPQQQDEEFTRSTPREQPSPASAGCSSRLTRCSRSSWGSGPRMSDLPGPGLRSGLSLPFGDSPVEQHRHDSNRIDQDHHEPSCIRDDVAQQDGLPCIA